MSAEYRLIVRSPAGAKQAEVSNSRTVRYAKRLCEPGLASFELLDDDPTLQYLVWRAQIEIWRRHIELGLDWYCDFYGLVMDTEWADGPPGVVTITAAGQMTMLGWRAVFYPAETAGRSAFAGAKPETIAKTMVTYNATASGTTGDGRKRNAAISGATITVQVDAASGSAMDWNCAFDNLLVSIQKLATVSGMDFDLIKTAAATWDFRWYATQRGVDRSTTLLFTPNRDNIAKASYSLIRRESKTVALVGGRGTGPTRDTVLRTGADYAADYDIETFVNSSGQNSTTAAYNVAGDRALDGLRARPEARFDVRQTPACYYGLHYCVAGELGDRVRWAMWAQSGTAKIVGVNVEVRGKAETISVETANV